MKIKVIGIETIHGSEGIYNDLMSLQALDGVKSQVYEVPCSSGYENAAIDRLQMDYPCCKFEKYYVSILKSDSEDVWAGRTD